jgi:hypothetical protein
MLYHKESMKKPRRKTRFARVLFERDNPYSQKVERKKTAYTRRAKHNHEYEQELGDL